MKKGIVASICVILAVSTTWGMPNLNPPVCKQHSISPKLTYSGDAPFATLAVHNVGNIQMSVTNIGQFTPAGLSYLAPGYFVPDPLTGLQAPYCIYPANSDIDYLVEGGIWVGALLTAIPLCPPRLKVVEFLPNSGRTDSRRAKLQ